MKNLVKNPNLYMFDDITDDNYAIDFSLIDIEEKYGLGKEYLRQCHKRLYIEQEAKLSAAMNCNIFDTGNQNFEDFEELCNNVNILDNMYFFVEEGYDDEFIYHDTSIDYDYDYENDCEYDGDEEIFGYDDDYMEDEYGL